MITTETLVRPADNMRGGCCGVTCVAVLAGVSFRDAWMACARARAATGRRVTRRWTGATTWLDRAGAMRRLGFVLDDVPMPARRMTLQRWTLLYAKPGRTYMVRTGSHVQIVRDGRVLDQSTPSGVPVLAFWGRRKMVTHAWTARRVS